MGTFWAARSASNPFRGIGSSGNHRLGLVHAPGGASNSPSNASCGSSGSNRRTAAIGHGSADDLASGYSVRLPIGAFSFGAVYRTIPFGP
ncbi:MAG: hypothetical protein ACRD4E_01785 [Bryobacteraceae bacterium]